MVEWMERMSEAVAYMEANLTHEIDMAEVTAGWHSAHRRSPLGSNCALLWHL